MRNRRAAILIALLLALTACGDDDTTVTTANSTTTPVPSTVATTTTQAPVATVWSRVPNDTTNLGGTGEQRIGYVTTGGPGLVAVGAESIDGDPDAAIWASVDGLVWTRIPHDETLFGGTSSQGINGAVAGGPGMVAVGYDYAVTPGGESTAAVWTSSDGLAWSRVPNDEVQFGGAGSQIMMAVVAGGPGLVAVGWDAFGSDETDAAVWVSVDGLAWTRAPHDEATLGGDGRQTMSWVTRLGDTLVAVGWDESGGDFDAAVWTSIDGVAWTRLPSQPGVFGGAGSQRMRFVVAAGPGLVAVGDDDADGTGNGAIWTSSDGESWDRLDGAAFGGPNDESLQAVAAGGPGLVAVGSEYVAATDEEFAVVWVSEDGLVWERLADLEVFHGGQYTWMRTVVPTPGGLLAAGGDGASDDYDAAIWLLAPSE